MRAFLSHASEDKSGLSSRLLRASRDGRRPVAGHLGDHARRQPRQEAVRRRSRHRGRRAASWLVSASSAAKPWAREELDAAVVRRITSSTRLIPVRLDDAPVPSPIQHLTWISADRTPGGIRSAAEQITDALYARDKRPAVAPPPGYTAAAPIPGLTQADSALLAVLIEEALACEFLVVTWPVVRAKAEGRGMTAAAIEGGLRSADAEAVPQGQVHRGRPAEPRTGRLPRSGAASTPSCPAPRRRVERSSPSSSTTLPSATVRCTTWPR